jgi:hypothetical protein
MMIFFFMFSSFWFFMCIGQWDSLLGSPLFLGHDVLGGLCAHHLEEKVKKDLS